MRNPLYWGNMLIFAGLLTVFANPFALALFVVFLFLQYHFIVLAEESFLREQHGQAYEDYCRRVRRWLPRFDRHAPPGRPFDLKKVLFKENDSCFNLLLGALLVMAWKERYFSGRPAPSPGVRRRGDRPDHVLCRGESAEKEGNGRNPALKNS